MKQMRNASVDSEEPREIARATFEVPRDLYDAFMQRARLNDQTGSQEIRRFMREYVDEQAAA